MNQIPKPPAGIDHLAVLGAGEAGGVRVVPQEPPQRPDALGLRENLRGTRRVVANYVLLQLCKGVHCVDLGENFPTHILLQNLASIQPRTSPVKFARSSNAAARR